MTQTVRYKDKFSLSYAEFGNQNGFPILINHGLIASIKDYALFKRLIALGARLVCMARPGYGASDPYELKNIAEWADMVGSIIEELGLSQFDVLGMSSGAPYSYAIGYKFPDKVRNIYIFSGIPALYADEVLAVWPHPVNKQASLPELQSLAHELFFANVPEVDLEKNDIKDSMMNECFGLALDFKIRCLDWGFTLAEVQETVFMQHSRYDNLAPVEITARLLPNCRLVIKESDVHFSEEMLDEFIQDTIAPFYSHE